MGDAECDKVVIAVFQVQRGFADELLGKVQVSIVDVEKMRESPSVPFFAV